MKNSSILITGASGFIGSRVVGKLYKDYKVIAVVSPYSTSNRLQHLKNKVTIIKSDLSDFKSVESLFKKYKPTSVLHLATHGVYQYQQDDTNRIGVDNYLMTYNLLQNSKKYGIMKFINTGSVFEYGGQRKKVKESDIYLDNILNLYSAVKIATTALVNSYSDDFSVVTLRPFTTYGPGEDDTRFIKANLKRALKNQEIKIAPGVIRDFVYVDDVAEAYTKALITDIESGEIINIASGKKHTLDEVATIIKKSSGSKSEIKYEDGYKRKRESACWANIEKAKKILNWKPKHSILQGIEKMIYSSSA